jgi:hypothetical protein
MYGTLSGAMMAATRTETVRADAPRPARRAPGCLTQPKLRPRLMSRLKSALIARRAAL